DQPYDFSKVLDMHLTVWKGDGGLNTVYTDTVETVTTVDADTGKKVVNQAVKQVFRIDGLASDWNPNVAADRQWKAVNGPKIQSVPLSVPDSIPGGINPGGSGELFSPIVADPSDRDSFYIAG